MTDITRQEIDTSPEAVAAVLADMRLGQNELDAMGLIETLSAKLAEAQERIQQLTWPDVNLPIEPDEAIDAIDIALVDCAYVDFVSKKKAYPSYKTSPKDIGALIALARSYRAQRDAALAEVERLRKENETGHTDRSVPCPKCGFVIREVKALPFVFEDDDSPAPPAEGEGK